MVVLVLFVVLIPALAFYVVFLVALCRDRVSYSRHPIFGKKHVKAEFVDKFEVIFQTERYPRAA